MNNLSPPVIAIIVIVALFILIGLKDKVADWGGKQIRDDAERGRGVRNPGLLALGGIIVFALIKNQKGYSALKLSGLVGYTFNWPTVD